MKFTLALFLMFGFTLQAQKRDVPAVICMNNGDTLKTNIEVLVNLFDDKMIKDISFASKVKLSKA